MTYSSFCLIDENEKLKEGSYSLSSITSSEEVISSMTEATFSEITSLLQRGIKNHVERLRWSFCDNS